MLKPVGILGGSFDPVHNGHLFIAQQCLDFLNLDHIQFIPSGNPPHREMPKAGIADRRNMLELALNNNPNFVINDCELKKDSKSYTYETLVELRKNNPNLKYFLIIGYDAFLGFVSWYRWQDIFDLCHVVIASRNQEKIKIKDISLTNVISERQITDKLLFNKIATGKIFKLELPLIDISSTNIRSEIKRGKKINDLVPSAVAQYIYQHHLYEQVAA